MPDPEQSKFDAAFWFQWIVATTLGWILGGAFFPVVALVAGGMATGLLQWPILYRRLDKAWMWPLSGAIGWLGGWLAALMLVPAGFEFLAGLFAGAGAGVGQWFYLRARLRWAGWWIPVNALAWTSALSILAGVLMSGAIAGAMTGIALDLLLRHPKPGSETDPASYINRLRR